MIGRIERAVGYTILTLATVIVILPLLGVLVMALDSPGSGSAAPSLANANHFGNFAAVWQQAGFGSALRASAIIALPTVAITVVASVPAGYGFAIMKFRGRSLLFYTLLLGLLIPVEAMIIPLYFDLRPFGLTGNYWGVILPDSAFSIAFGGFWMRAAFLSAPRSLIEAARLDGANTLNTLRCVLLPLVRPQVLTLAVLVFVGTWNDFLFPLVMLSGSNIQTAPMSLVYFQGLHTTNFTYLASAAIITAIPVVIIYVLLQRSFLRGMISGAIRG